MHLLGPGGWRIEYPDEIQIDGEILRPDIVG